MKRTATEEEKRFLQALFDRPEKSCLDCGGYHLRLACPRIKRQVWIGNGNRIEAEYWQDGQWDDSEVIYPEDVFDTEPEDADE
jgi:hypothetical protein